MKNTFILLLLFIIIGCNKTSDGSVSEYLPVPPTNLTANIISDTQIDLSWTDKSTNENGFKIQRKTDLTSFSDIGITGSDVTIYNDKNLSPNTSYTYRVYSYNSVGNSATYSNEISVKTIPSITIPILTTSSVSCTSIEAICSGAITNRGGGTLSEFGVCWSTNSNPTIANFKKAATSGTNNAFGVQINNLQPGTKYYIRTYATTNAGTGYGNELSFTTKVYFTSGSGVTDIDGNTYKTIKMGTQEWMSENLRTTKYANGDLIINGIADEWSNGSTSGLWCYYENNSQFNNPYGKLYNWYAITDSRKACPTGWHIPSNNEWSILFNLLGNKIDAGGKLKESGTTHWKSPNTGANNESGFTALPAGARSGSSQNSLGTRGYFWSTTEWNATTAYQMELVYAEKSAELNSRGKVSGISVRCIKD